MKRLATNLSNRRLLGSVTLMSALLIANASAAFAGTGSVQNAKCGGAAAEFITLPPDEAKNGFGGADKASRLVNGGNGECGVIISIDKKSKAMWTNTDGQVKISDSDLKNVKLRIVIGKAYKEVNLKDHAHLGKPDKNGWRSFHCNARGTGVYRTEIDGLRFVIPGRGNITVGDMKFQMYSGPLVTPSELITEVGDCKLLNEGKPQ